MPISELWAKACAHAHALGARDLKELDGCYEFTAGDFRFAINGHPTEFRDAKSLDGAVLQVPPFDVAVFGKGAADVGLVSKSAGVIPPALEDEAIAALDAATKPRHLPEPKGGV